MNDIIQIESLNKSFRQLIIYQDFNISFAKDQITAILGPSGCGKTTLLNILAGLDRDTKAPVSFDTSYVFQESRLLPWLNLLKNIEFVLPQSWDKTKKREIAEKYLTAVGLKEFMNYYPNKLSGGMRQRVSIARAFARPCQLMLMDEPFKGLDIHTKEELIDLFLSLWQTEPCTVIAVTHDPEEAWRLGDSVVLFSRPPVKLLLQHQISRPKQQRLSTLDSNEYLSLRSELYSLMGD